MSPPPARPLIYHITHGKNLERIIAEGCLWSDAEMINRGGPEQSIGMSRIKQTRLKIRLDACHPGTTVGQYVPFYFCPRSVMLYLLHKGNHPDIPYRQGQRPILHLAADLYEVMDWATGEQRPWAFTDANAGSSYFRAYADRALLNQLKWEHIFNDDWSEPEVKNAKQSEFLVFGSFPWSLVKTIGTFDEKVAARVRKILGEGTHLPDVQVQRGWYY